MKAMKAMVAALLGACLVAGLAAPADAGGRAKKRGYAVKYKDRTERAPSPGRSDYYEHIADKLPFGSSVWWEQMSRERRGGRPG